VTTTLADAVDLDSSVGILARGFQLLLVGLIGYGAVVGNGGLLVNGILALPLAFSASLIEWRYDHEIAPHLSVWITVAAVVHVAGFLGPYSVQSGALKWYDQVAHTISASFVAGVGYALVAALDHSSARVQFPDEFRFVFTLCFILAFGVAWEIVEFGAGTFAGLFGGGAALVQYGLDDIVLDLVFNTIGAAIVALAGTRYFRSVTAILSRRLFGSSDS
jgi:hypothetical protein